VCSFAAALLCVANELPNANYVLCSGTASGLCVDCCRFLHLLLLLAGTGKHCLECGEEEGEEARLLRCGSCKMAYYCSRACQKVGGAVEQQATHSSKQCSAHDPGAVLHNIQRSKVTRKALGCACSRLCVFFTALGCFSYPTTLPLPFFTLYHHAPAPPPGPLARRPQGQLQAQ
jgi:hypothetical protein